MSRDRKAPHHVGWEQQALLPPNEITIALRLDLDGSSGFFGWSITVWDGNEVMQEMYCRPITRSPGACLDEALQALDIEFGRQCERLAPF